MIVKELMTPKADVVNPDASLMEAAKLMTKNDYGFLPVCDGEKIIGVITDRDIVINAVAKNQNLDGFYVKDVMTKKVICCYDNDDLQKVRKLMEDKKVRRVIVLDENKKLAGIISLGDIVTKQDSNEISSSLIKNVSEKST